MYKTDRRVEAKGILAEFLNKENITVSGARPDLVEKEHIITAQITGKIIEFIDVNGKDEVGKQSFPADMLESNKPFVISEIKAEYGAQLTADALAVDTTDYNLPAPAALNNGNFKLVQDDRGTIVDLLMASIFNNSETNNNKDKYHVLEKMEVLKAQSSLLATGKLPAALDASKVHFIKITMKGYVPRSK